MRHLVHFCWHKAREYLGHLFFIGLFFLVAGTAPEEWVKEKLDWLGGLIPSLDLIALTEHYWPPWLDVRVALFALGTALATGSVIWRQRVRRHEHPPPPQPTPTPAPAPVVHVHLDSASRSHGHRSTHRGAANGSCRGQAGGPAIRQHRCRLQGPRRIPA